MDDFSNELSVASLCVAETTFTNHVVLQETLDHIREGTLHKIPGGRQVTWFKKDTQGLINDAKTKGALGEITLPVVFEHQFDFAITHSTELKDR